MKTLGVMGLGHLAAASVAGFLLVTPALAADFPIDAPVMETPPAESMFDVAFGVTLTTDYISRGFTQTDHGFAVQPWVELDYGMFYAGYWGSNVSPVSVSGANWEHDLSIGVRPTLGPVSLDLGYVRYIYDNGDCCGEIYLKGSINPAPATFGAAVFFDPDSSNAYFEANGKFELPHNFAVSGALGVQTYGNSDPSVFSWNAGGSWSPLDWLTLDGRYYGGPTADRFVVALILSSSLSALHGN
jgi:uncharacterized protein (TIGR02001 family)